MPFNAYVCSIIMYAMRQFLLNNLFDNFSLNVSTDIPYLLDQRPLSFGHHSLIVA